MEKQWEKQAPRSAYVHVPFCRRRCFYCDFPISVVGDRLTGESSGMMAEYVSWLIREIEQAGSPKSSPGVSLRSVFFGGGTPSLLAPGQIAEILQALEQLFGFDSEIEISMEIDPGTFDQSRLQAWLGAGVNRFSLGVQAFQDELLEACGRSHRVVDVWRSVELMTQVNNWSLDLISGLPGQNLELWQRSLDWAIETGSTHLSVYDLTIEPETVFGKRELKGRLLLPVEEAVVEMYRMTRDRLKAAGFSRYEVSSYARAPQYECQHNRVYWAGLPFYGFGMGATSFVDGVRMARSRTRSDYFDWVKTLSQQAPDLASDQPSESCQSDEERERDIFLERVMMGLRLVEGIEIAGLVDRFGAALVEEAIVGLTEFVTSGLLIVANGRMFLSDPEGLLMSNVVLVKLFETIQK